MTLLCCHWIHSGATVRAHMHFLSLTASSEELPQSVLKHLRWIMQKVRAGFGNVIQGRLVREGGREKKWIVVLWQLQMSKLWLCTVSGPRASFLSPRRQKRGEWKKQWEKTSGNGGTESHFHAIDSCQICHLSSYTINQSLRCYHDSSNQKLKSYWCSMISQLTTVTRLQRFSFPTKLPSV